MKKSNTDNILKGCGKKGYQGAFTATCGKELWCTTCITKAESRIDALEEILGLLIYWRNELQDWYGSEWIKHDKIFVIQIKYYENDISKLRRMVGK